MSVAEARSVTRTRAEALAHVAAAAAALDRAPRFPSEAFAVLRDAGLLRTDGAMGSELDLLRAVAAADASVGRILDGHLNAVERVALLAPPDVREELLDGARLLGVWGADPAAGEGNAARLHGRGDTPVLRGSKVFCSGAGGVDAAIVAVRDDAGAARLALVELGPEAEIDRGWFAASGMRASESHRVTFHDAPVRALLGGDGELVREPWFGRDAVRTAATWAGIADAARAEALAVLDPASDLAALAAGRMAAAAGTIDRWLQDAGPRADAALRDATALTLYSIALRAAVAGAATAVVDAALGAAGSRPLATGQPLDRAARDLRVFLLQHRLDPLLTRLGRAELEARR